MLLRCPVGIFCLLLWASPGLRAQMDTIHWLPPMFPGVSVVSPFLDLTTPEAQPFQVSIRDGAGNLLHTASVSNTQPVRVNLTPFYGKVVVPKSALHKVSGGNGLVVSGPRPFFASFRVITDDNTSAGFLVCKGRSALGRTFRIGHVRQVTDKAGDRFNLISVMASEDSTVVELSGFDPLTAFKMELYDDLVSSPVSMTLNKGQSVVFAHYIGAIGDDQPRNGFMGALLEASKPVAVSSGSWMGAPVILQVSDIGIDQLLPLEKIGREYILCRGNGATSLEHPIVVAHSNNTAIRINGETDPVAVLQAGEYFIVPATYYIPTNSMYIKTSEPAFVYQMLGGIPDGPTSLGTVSLMFIPPISCGLNNRIDNIHLPNKTGDTGFSGSLMVVAMRDSAVTVRFNDVPKDIGPPTPVPGNDDFVTYRALNIMVRTQPVQRLSITSGGALQAMVLARQEGASYAATFSGPEIRPTRVQLAQYGDGICPDTLKAGGDFDVISWVYEDSLLAGAADTFLQIPAPGPYKAIVHLAGCRQTAHVADSLTASLIAPQFQYAFGEPTCFGYRDGHILFGLPNGGVAPYRFSIDRGGHFSGNPLFEQLAAGDYTLVAEDAAGCYNQPLHLVIGQPDSLYVRLEAVGLSLPLHPGSEVVVEGTPGGPVVTTDWTPAIDPPCPGCLRDTLYPEKATWVRLLVTDSAGCTATDSLFLPVESPVYAPNVMLQGAGSDNDRFVLFSDRPLPVSQLFIFDRWGNEVFERRDFFTNDPDSGWDGNFRNRAVAPGIYVFFARVEVSPGKIVELRGDVAVLR